MNANQIIRRPLVTEKSTILREEENVISFEVDGNANKIQVKQAVERIFGVKVRAVNILNVKPKKKRVLRSRNFRDFGFKGGYKKAIVSLEPGHTIDIFGDI